MNIIMTCSRCGGIHVIGFSNTDFGFPCREYSRSVEHLHLEDCIAHLKHRLMHLEEHTVLMNTTIQTLVSFVNDTKRTVESYSTIPDVAIFVPGPF